MHSGAAIDGSGAALAGQLRWLRVYAAFTYPFVCVPFLYFWFRDAGITLAGYGDVIACYYLAMVVTEVPTGVLADRWGRKPMLVAGPLVLAAGFMLLVAVPTKAGFCVGEALLGVGHAVLSGSPAALLYGTLARHGQAAHFVREESHVHALRLAGTGVSFLLGGVIVALWGFAPAIVATAALLLVASAAALRLADVREATGERPPIWAAALADLRRREVQWIALWFVVTFVLLRYLFHTYQAWLEAANEEDPLLIGVLLCAMNLLAAPASRLVPWVQRRAGVAGAFWIVLLALTLSMLPLAWVIERGALLLFFVHQVPFGMHWALVQGYANHHVQGVARTTLLSLMSLLGRLAFVALFPLLVRLQETHGIGIAYTTVAVGGLLLGAATMALRPR